MVELSEQTRVLVRHIFPEAQVSEVEHLLETDCADNLGLPEPSANPEGLERIRFAALRLSGSSLEGLVNAVVLARTDWRDLLMAAGFARDLDAHLAWHRSIERGT